MSDQLIFSALIADCNNDIAAARAELSIYLRSSVGIGEHPQHIDEAKKILQKLINRFLWESKMESILQKRFKMF